MVPYYITDKFLIKNGFMYYTENQINNNVTIKINNNNFVKYLVDNFNYELLPIQWRKRLSNNINNNNRNNCKFLVLDCGGSGDCLFYVIAEALNNNMLLNNLSGELYTIQQLRKIAASCITNKNYNIIIETYKLEETSYDFNGLWYPSNINNKKALQNEIKKCGNNFWGDHIIMQLLQDKLKINIILLNDGDYGNGYHIIPTGSNIHKYKNTILVYYDCEIHFKLIGYFNGKIIKTHFNNNEIPLLIKNVYNIDSKLIN